MNRIAHVWTKMRLLTKVNLIVGTVLMFAFSYVAVTVYFGAASQIRYASNDFPGAKKAASSFLKLSPFQRHIGYYNRGTAEAAVGDFDPAQADLESALEITPPAHECAVRINLSYVYEKQADQVADQDPDQSKELYDRSLKTLEDAPEECQPEKSEEQQKSDEAKERVEDKKEGQQAKEEGSEGDESESDDSQDGDQSSDGSGDESDSGEDEQGEDSGEDEKSEDPDEGKSESEKKREELKERGENSEKNQQQQGPGGEGGRSTPEKPW